MERLAEAATKHVRAAGMQSASRQPLESDSWWDAAAGRELWKRIARRFADDGGALIQGN